LNTTLDIEASDALACSLQRRCRVLVSGFLGGNRSGDHLAIMSQLVIISVATAAFLTIVSFSCTKI
jgi:hypothetical protein